MLAQRKYFYQKETSSRKKQANHRPQGHPLPAFLSEAGGKSTGHPHSLPETSPLEWSVISTLEDMTALEAEWRQLETDMLSSSNVFLTYEWNYHWANTFLQETADSQNGLRILVARRAGTLVSLWPPAMQNLHGQPAPALDG